MASMKSGSGSGLSRRTIAIGFGAAVAAAVVLIAVALVLQGDDDTSGSASATDLSGIAQDGRFLGQPDAGVLMIEYADMQCPFCADYSNDVFPALVEDYVRPGDVRMEFRGLAFLGPDSETALRYVVGAALQDHGWDMQEALFREQGGENAGWVTENLARDLASDIPGLDVERLLEDADGAAVTAEIQEMAEQGQADQVPGTPTFFLQIGDAEPYLIQVPLNPDAFRAALDDALQG